jgi:prepilin-type N-terminal cleavage/methylation domain-containing protein
VTDIPVAARRRTRSQQCGFSLIEMLVSITVLTIVSTTALTGVMNLTKTSSTISNRTEMHAGVRNATELLQQEVGQAGRIVLPAPATLAGPVAAGAATVAVTSLAGVGGIFVGEKLVVGTGANEETVTVTAVNTATNQITATFANAHVATEPIAVYGGFAAGVIPPSTTNGSTGSLLKIFGDINGNGQMVYIEYKCDLATGNLYRRSMAYSAIAKPAISADLSLLNNIIINPNGVACFTYQEVPANGMNFVVDVAITLTVQTAAKDPVTGLFQKETKALLNVSPRNVFNVWQMAGLTYTNRVQSTPPTVTALLALP